MTWDKETARKRLGLADDDASKDPAIESAMAVALAACESYCDRRFLEQADEQEFAGAVGPVLLVRRWPLKAITALSPLDPQADPAPDPVPVPAAWRIDKKRGMVYMVGAAPWAPTVELLAAVPPPWAVAGRAGFVLHYTGGYDPLPADLEAAMWMTFDNVWASTPGAGADPGSQGGTSGAVKSFGIDGMKIDYDTSTSAGSVGAGGVSAWGLLPANAVGILQSYRAETAALGG